MPLGRQRFCNRYLDWFLFRDKGPTVRSGLSGRRACTSRRRRAARAEAARGAGDATAADNALGDGLFETAGKSGISRALHQRFITIPRTTGERCYEILKFRSNTPPDQ